MLRSTKWKLTCLCDNDYSKYTSFKSRIKISQGHLRSKVRSIFKSAQNRYYGLGTAIVRQVGIITCHQRYRPNFEARPSCIIAVLLSMQERTVTHAVFSGIYTSALAWKISSVSERINYMQSSLWNYCFVSTSDLTFSLSSSRLSNVISLNKWANANSTRCLHLLSLTASCPFKSSTVMYLYI